MVSPLLITKALRFTSFVLFCSASPHQCRLSLAGLLSEPAKSKYHSFTLVICGLSLPICLLLQFITAGCVFIGVIQGKSCPPALLSEPGSLSFLITCFRSVHRHPSFELPLFLLLPCCGLSEDRGVWRMLPTRTRAWSLVGSPW